MKAIKNHALSLIMFLTTACTAAQASTSYQLSSIANNLRDVSDATQVVSGDDIIVPVALPFTFDFYGVAYNTARVSTNGFLTFSQNIGSGCCQGETFPNASIGIAVAPGWTDWVNRVTTKTSGAPGSQEFIISWVGNEFGWNSPDNIQLILHQGSNNIEFQYGNTFAANSYHALSAGIQNGNADGINIVTNNNLTGKAFLISAVPEPETYALLLVGLAILAGQTRRTQIKKQNRT